jgi:large subunit ribosomal protein L5
MTERLKTLYQETIAPDLQKELGLRNTYQVPRLSKIVINQGLGEALQNSKILETALKELSLISGQKGVITRSKKAIAAFKLRSKTPVGIKVVLRGKRMYAFLDRFIRLSLPRIRDFQGIRHQSFDACGNYSLGLEEQLMFPEIHYDKVDQLRGMDISIVTNAKNPHAGRLLLKGFGLPFRDN